MKFTNVKQLIIKFMGGGLINFPTRFLRWVKINGDNDSDDSGDDSGSYDDNILILNNEEYNNFNLTSQEYLIYIAGGDIDYESEEDLTISIYELDESIINGIINNINNDGYVPIRIGGSAENMIVIDKFEDLNNHYEQHGDMLQDVKIHINKTATMLPITYGGII